ncbi:single-stranded-DNA-specific exonuclease RecJ [Candidatus Woesebacteria bacterium]|nr:single-stranded-DNA-specific exonuclease RecJ [Candidatus Woesebacteria bacterium]
MNKKRKWEILSKGTKPPSGTLDLNKITDILLENRGLKSKKEKDEFVNPTDPQDLTLKELKISLKEVIKVIVRLKRALKNKEKIIIYGDYDADGVSATAILWEALYRLKFNVLPYIPERFSEGYGIKRDQIIKLKKEVPDLKVVITVDNGIVANEAIKEAKKLGIDVIISDHHIPGKVKPKALATIHTTLIGGAGVSWILSREISKAFKEKKVNLIRKGLDLAAIGTIADQLPLVGPNRSIVKFGLIVLNKTDRAGLLALIEKSGITLGRIGCYEVGFIIAPRLNSMGRMEHAIESLRLLCTKNIQRAAGIADLLNRTNLERQKTVDEVVVHARARVGIDAKGVIILAHESYHEGVIGLAASRMVEEFYRPVIIMSKKEGISKASARSISGFNIIENIRKASEFLLEGGGHPMAAGFSIESKDIEKFSKKLNRVSRKLLNDEILTKKLRIDAELGFDQVNWELTKVLKGFDPVGIGNLTPTFVTYGAYVNNCRIIGKGDKHIKLQLQSDGKTIEAVGFNFGNLYSKLTPGTKVDLVYSVEENRWNGNSSIQLKIKDITILN